MQNFSKIVVGIVLSLLVVWTSPVLAHSSPENCVGSGLGISLYADVTEVYIGDTVSFSVDVFNGGLVGPAVCDVTNIEAYIVTPDGVSHTITLTRAGLLNAQVDHYENVASYVARIQDILSGGILRITARDTGVVHQNDTDSQGGGSQGVNIGVLSPPPTVSPPVITTTSPPPTTRNPRRGSRRHPIIVPIVVETPPVVQYVATLPVSIPVLPSTGFPPRNEHISRDLTFLFGALVVSLIPLVVVFKKSSI